MYCCSLVSLSSFTWKKAIPPSLTTYLKIIRKKTSNSSPSTSYFASSASTAPPARKDPCSSSPLPGSLVPGNHTHTHTHPQPRRRRWWFYLKWDSARITPARFGLLVICNLIWLTLFDQSEQVSPVVSVGGLKTEMSGLTPRDGSQSLLSGDLKALCWQRSWLGFFHIMLGKNLNNLFGHPSVTVNSWSANASADVGGKSFRNSALCFPGLHSGFSPTTKQFQVYLKR